jgi:hypothetical protein
MSHERTFARTGASCAGRDPRSRTGVRKRTKPYTPALVNPHAAGPCTAPAKRQDEATPNTLRSEYRHSTGR